MADKNVGRRKGLLSDLKSFHLFIFRIFTLFWNYIKQEYVIFIFIKMGYELKKMIRKHQFRIYSLQALFHLILL